MCVDVCECAVVEPSGVPGDYGDDKRSSHTYRVVLSVPG